MFSIGYIAILFICIIGVGYTSYKRGFDKGCADTTTLFIDLGLVEQEEVQEAMKNLLEEIDRND